MNIYCQYSIAGYKVFQLTSLPHSHSNLRYVKMDEISDALSSDDQQIIITRKCHCNLDQSIVSLFSSRQVGLMLLHNTGKDHNQTVLYVNDIDSKTTFAFSTQDDAEIELLAKLTCMWRCGRNNIIEKLGSLVGKTEVDKELVFAFFLDKWNELRDEMLSISPANSLFEDILEGKNVLFNLSLDKNKILESAGINFPLSSFVIFPGNSKIAELERKNKIIKYSIIGAFAIFSFSLIAYCFGRCK